MQQAVLYNLHMATTGKDSGVLQKGNLIATPTASTTPAQAAAARAQGFTTAAPAYNAATGATTGTPSAEYTSYLKSLNDKSSANYVPTPDDKGYANMDTVNNASVAKGTGTVNPINPATANTLANDTSAGQIVKNADGTVGFQPAASPVSVGDTSTKYQQTNAAAQASNTPVPGTKGAGMGMVRGFLPEQSADTTAFDATLKENKSYQQSTQDLTDYLLPQSTQDRLNSYMDKLTADQAGLTEDKMKLMSVQNIMSGTEDAIRAEITAAGGLASNNQVLALTTARNKTLLQDATFLQGQLTIRQDAVKNDLDLYNMAKGAADTQFSHNLAILQYQDQNAKDIRNANTQSYQWLASNIGLDNILKGTGGDPSKIAYAEKGLNMQPGTLVTAAAQVASDRAKKDRLDQANLNKIYMETSKLQKEAGASNLTPAQATARGYGIRTFQAAQTINSLGETFAKRPSLTLPFGLGNLNAIKTSEYQQFDQAKRNFVNAVLRRESGAAISNSEFTSAERQYFPVFGDKKETLDLKTQNRNTVIQNILRESGIQEDPTTLALTPSGELVKIK